MSPPCGLCGQVRRLLPETLAERLAAIELRRVKKKAEKAQRKARQNAEQMAEYRAARKAFYDVARKP